MESQKCMIDAVHASANRQLEAVGCVLKHSMRVCMRKPYMCIWRPEIHIWNFVSSSNLSRSEEEQR